MRRNTLFYSVFIVFGIVMISLQAWTVYRIKPVEEKKKNASPSFTSLGTKTWHDEKSNVTTSVGPWGVLERVPLIIAPPLEFAAVGILDKDPDTWYFPNMTPEQFEMFVTSLDLPVELKSKLLMSSVTNDAIKGFTTTVNAEIRSQLTLTARKKIYDLLSISELNPFQENAYRFPADQIDIIFNRFNVRPEISEMIRKFSYRNGKYNFFADAPILQALVPDSDEDEVFRTLATESTFLLKLRLTDEVGLDAILDYWGRGGRAKDIGPFIESIKDSSDEPTVDVVHFLPGFARRRLYTYPRPDETGNVAPRDCHWTAFNFFSDMPSDEFSDPKRIIEALEKEYTPIFGNYGFGDLVLFWDESKSIFHSAVMIADDILFTKNGSSSTSPWIFMSIKDMLDYYPRNSKITITYYRKNDL